MMRRAMFLGVGLCLVAGLAWAAGDTTGVTDTTIKIGMFGPLTGAVSIYGYPINNGAIMIYEEANAKGGIHGRKIEIVHEDDACDPAKGVAAVKKLIHRDRVFLIHGGSCSATVLAAREEVVTSKVPLMVMAATADKISAPVARNIFTTTLPASLDGKVAAEFILSNPAFKRVAIVSHEDEWGRSKSDSARERIRGAGAQIVADVALDRRITDATAQVAKIKEAQADVTMVVAYPAEGAVFLRDALKYGLKGSFIGPTSLTDLDDLVKRAGSAEAIRDLYVISFLRGAVGGPEMKPYEDLLRRHFPKDKVQSVSFYGTSGAVVLTEVLRRIGRDLSRERLIEELEKARDMDTGTNACKVSFTPEDHQGCRTGSILTLVEGKTVYIGSTWKKVK